VKETRLRFKQSTFAAFIDFSKAYDLINRVKLWERLKTSSVSGNLMKAIKSLYASVSSSVRVNSHQTDWFEVNCGLRQGCILSPVLFNLYINDLALYLKASDIGINVGDDKICMLLYADDIVLLANNENELQILLSSLNDWCLQNDMSVNANKCNIVHFRT